MKLSGSPSRLGEKRVREMRAIRRIAKPSKSL